MELRARAHKGYHFFLVNFAIYATMMRECIIEIIIVKFKIDDKSSAQLRRTVGQASRSIVFNRPNISRHSVNCYFSDNHTPSP